MSIKTGYMYNNNGNRQEIYIEDHNIWDVLLDLDIYFFFPLMGLIAEGMVLFPLAILLWIINHKDNCVVSFLQKHNRKEVVFFDNTSFFSMLKKVSIWWLTFGPIRKTTTYIAKKRDENIIPVMDKTAGSIRKAMVDLDTEMNKTSRQE